MSHTITYKLEVSDTDSTLGNTQEIKLPADGEPSFTATYRHSIDLSIADSTTDQAVDLGSISTVTGVVLYSDGELTIEVGGEDVTITADKPYFSLCSSFTTFKVTNASGAAVSLKGTFWGN